MAVDTKIQLIFEKSRPSNMFSNTKYRSTVERDKAHEIEQQNVYR